MEAKWQTMPNNSGYRAHPTFNLRVDLRVVKNTKCIRKKITRNQKADMGAGFFCHARAYDGFQLAGNLSAKFKFLLIIKRLQLPNGGLKPC
jgi:hypothetical protein